MISLEQVKLLESKVSRTIDYVKKVTEENTALKGKLSSCQKRIDEMEVLIRQFKDEQSRIEGGILSALDRLNQFEDAVGSLLSAEGTAPAGKKPAEGGDIVKDKPLSAHAPAKKAEAAPRKEKSAPVPDTEPEAPSNADPGAELDIF